MENDNPEEMKITNNVPSIRVLEYQEKTPTANRDVVLSLTPWSRSEGMRFLPVQSTPPSSMFKIQNPFETVLLDKLHLPLCSPSVFTCKSTPKDSKDFEWTIEDISELKPANIEPFDSENIQPLDPITENRAQKAIDLFFKKHKIVPSPMEALKRTQLPLENGGVLFINGKKSSFAQTELTLPPKLPEDLENALKPYFSFKEHHHHKIVTPVINHEARDASLRRKLFTLEVESGDSFCDQSMDYSVLSPVAKSPVLFVPPRVNNFGTPTTFNDIQRNVRLENVMNSPDLSPISNSKSKKDKFLEDYSTNNNNSPLCQSTPEKKASNRYKTNMSYSHNTPEIFCKSRFLKQCTPDESDMSICDPSKCSTFNMSVDDNTPVKYRTNTILEPYDETMQSQSFTEGAPESELFKTKLTSPQRTPRSSRIVNAKNLSRSFNLSEYTNEQDIGGPHTKTDSGFTETFNENISTNNKFDDNIKFKTDFTNFCKNCNCNNVKVMCVCNMS